MKRRDFIKSLGLILITPSITIPKQPFSPQIISYDLMKGNNNFKKATEIEIKKMYKRMIDNNDPNDGYKNCLNKNKTTGDYMQYNVAGKISDIKELELDVETILYKYIEPALFLLAYKARQVGHKHNGVRFVSFKEQDRLLNGSCEFIYKDIIIRFVTDYMIKRNWWIFKYDMGLLI